MNWGRRQGQMHNRPTVFGRLPCKTKAAGFPAALNVKLFRNKTGERLLSGHYLSNACHADVVINQQSL